jgi:hypothetical protein
LEFQKSSFSGGRRTGEILAERELGDQSESLRLLQDLIAKHADASAYQVAEVYAWRGQKEPAFAWLERAFRQRDEGLTDINVDPLMNGLRGEPRYRELLKELKLSD